MGTIRASVLADTPNTADGSIPVDVLVKGSRDLSLSQEESGELSTFDKNLEKVFGSNPILSPDGKINVQSVPLDKSIQANIYTVQSYAQLTFSGMATAVIQLFGTWAGTITFEATANNADWVTFYGYNLVIGTGAIPVGTSTASGIFRFDVVGLKAIRARYSTYTSGICQVAIIVSGYTDAGSLVMPLITGSQTQLIQQRTSTYELNTYDTNLAVVLGTALASVPVSKPGIIAPTAPTLQTAGVAPWAYLTPQIYAQIRTLAGGSERLPFKQIPSTNDMSVQDVPLYMMLERLYVQLSLLGQALMSAKDISYPDGWELIK